MKQGNKKIFLDKPRLYQFINLRMNGYSITSLALLFNCHFTSIDAQCRKYSVPIPDTVYTIERIASDFLASREVKPQQKYEVIEGVRVNLGRNYKDYF